MVDSKTHFFKIFYGLVLLYSANGSVQLDSDIGTFPLDLSLQNVTFTCDVVDVMETAIHWFINNIAIASYHFSSTDMFPYFVNVDPPDTRLTVVLENAVATRSAFSFYNFTLITDVCGLVQFNNRNLSCGTTQQRSNSTTLNVDVEVSLNVTYEAVYGTEEMQLTQINAHWKDVLSPYQCNSGTSYKVELRDENSEYILNTIVSSSRCSNSVCSTSIPLNNSMSNVESYELTVTSMNEYLVGADGLNSSIVFESNLDVIKYVGCNLSINCSETFRNCSLMDDANNSIFIESGDIHYEDLSLIKNRTYSYMATTGPVMIKYTWKFRAEVFGTNSYLFGVGVAASIFGIILVTVGSMLGTFMWCKRKSGNFLYWCSACGCIIISYPIVLVTLTIWIVFGVSLNKSCIATTSTNLAISTSALAFFLILCSAIALAGFILAWKVDQKSYTFKFGIANEATQKESGSTCSVCKENIRIPKDVTHCETCGKVLCKGKCYFEPVFIFYKMDKAYVCKSCKEIYWKENEQFSHGDPVGKMASNMCGDFTHGCKVCKKKFNDNSIHCKSCHNKVCKDTCHGKLIQVKDKEEEVCNICYILHKRKEQWNHKKKHNRKSTA